MYTIRKLFIMLVVTSVYFTGCGGNIFEGLSDSDSNAAKKEEAKIALDKGNYDEAISQLEELCGDDLTNLNCDNETKSNLASAYMGASGLDVLKLIDAADQLSQVTTAESDFTTFSQLLPDQTTENVTNMYNAVTILSSIPAAERTDNENLQLATAAATSLILTVGAITSGFDADTGLPNRDLTADPVTTSELNQPASTIGIPASGSIGDTILSASTTIIEAASASLILAVDSGTGIGVATTDQITDINTTMDTDQSESISSTELSNYINTNLI